MKYCMLLLLPLLAFVSPNNTQGIDNKSQKIQDETDVFVQKFIDAVKSKNTSKIMACMDADYVRDQHDQFLKGNTKQFIDELFGGSAEKTGEWKNTPLKKIKNIELKSRNEEHLVFRIKSGRIWIRVELTLTVTTKNGDTVLGIRGAVG